MQDSNSGLERWRGKVALVTGASSGIGAAIAESLGEAGLKVVLAGRNRGRLQAVAKRVRAIGKRHGGGDVFVLTAEQTRMAENTRMFRRVGEHWGGIDVLVNCAGVRGGVSLLDAEVVGTPRGD